MSEDTDAKAILSKRFPSLFSPIDETTKKHLRVISQGIDFSGIPQGTPEKEAPIPEPDFQTVGVMIGGSILLQAINKLNEMWRWMDDGDIEEAMAKYMEIVALFPTAPLRQWLTFGKNPHDELQRRFDNFRGEYSFEKILPRDGISTEWYFHGEWQPNQQSIKDIFKDKREQAIARRYLCEELAQRVIDAINVISAFVPTDNRLTPEALEAAMEESQKDDEGTTI